MEPTTRSLPDNAYRKLQPGETYQPIVPPSSGMAQFTPWSAVLGLLMAVLFSAAAAFLGFKVGQVIEAAIPIAILAVGLGSIRRQRSTILENVIVQSVGAASGLVVAGAIFVLPALFIIELPVNLGRAAVASLLGGAMGVLLLIPLRRYFVRDMHGEYPFPEATATTEVLVAGESGGSQAKTLAVAAAVGGLYDFLTLHLKAFAETFTSRSIPGLAGLANETKLVFKMSMLTSVVGLGYIIGLKYAAIICAGSFLSWFLLVPLIGYFGQGLAAPLGVTAGDVLISQMTAEAIFRNYVRTIGIGAIACAGMLGIWRSRKIIVSAFGLAFREFLGGGPKSAAASERTDRDIPMRWVGLGLVAVAILLFVFFAFVILQGQPNALLKAAIALVVVMVISFLFTTVAAQAIATVGTNPVSGMTLMTLILSATILVGIGLRGEAGMLAALIIGCVVCTALSTVGGTVTDLKVGYWIGATPAVQQVGKLIGIVAASLTVGWVMVVLNQVYGFKVTAAHPEPLAAPQANAMAAVVQAMMSDQPAPWLLYGLGALLILVLQMVGIPALPFALGMYIPQDLNTPLLVGGLVAYFVAKSAGGNETLARARTNRGTLIASGFIAGGAIMGVVAALLRWATQERGIPTGVDLLNNAEGTRGELVALVLYVLVVAYMYWDSRRTEA